MYAGAAQGFSGKAMRLCDQTALETSSVGVCLHAEGQSKDVNPLKKRPVTLLSNYNSTEAGWRADRCTAAAT